ncbi:hypothetical protein [uncultured Pontibacter sp.]|uniref:hypothetical protein n=1 Tax=uncultured Pontibacter sp. TaxID=453356 RepID=UPI00262F7F67|nr:hypothetical protein [uncultured Pontibacter sp.]
MLELKAVLDKDFVTIRYSAEQKLIRNEWRGVIPSVELRAAMIYSCEFILANKVELILADFTLMCAPTLEDQVWIANHTAALLQHSNLKRVANLMAQDLFQQIAVQAIYDMASEIPLPCESRDFVTEEDALEWLFSP